MTKLFITLLGLTLAVALVFAQQDESASAETPQIKEGQFLLHLWQNKQTCEGKPTLAVSLINDPNKCQVVLKDFFWAKGACENDRLTGKVCTDAQCQSCFDIPDVAPQNTCKHEPLLQGAYKYTCSATKQNVTKAKEAQPTQEVNQTIGEQVKEKVEEKMGDSQQAETSEFRAGARESKFVRVVTPRQDKMKDSKIKDTKIKDSKIVQDKFKSDRSAVIS